MIRVSITITRPKYILTFRLIRRLNSHDKIHSLRLYTCFLLYQLQEIREIQLTNHSCPTVKIMRTFSDRIIKHKTFKHPLTYLYPHIPKLSIYGFVGEKHIGRNLDNAIVIQCI